MSNPHVFCLVLESGQFSQSFCFTIPITIPINLFVLKESNVPCRFTLSGNHQINSIYKIVF